MLWGWAVNALTSIPLEMLLKMGLWLQRYSERRTRLKVRAQTALGLQMRMGRGMRMRKRVLQTMWMQT